MANAFDKHQQVVEHLQLQDYYPKKLTREEALVVSKSVITPDELSDPGKIPWYILQNLLMCKYEGRCYNLDQNQSLSSAAAFSMSSFLQDYSEDVDHCDEVSPLDALVATFLCCDDFLRQTLIEKLSTCQLAIPLLVPFKDVTDIQWEMIVWGISTIRKKWKISSGFSCEKFMSAHGCPIVSALRIGRPQISKSKIINCVINEQRHDIFFHSECKGGHLQRKISDGLLEMTWYLPNQKSTHAFSEAHTFINLRGNSSDSRSQTQFLSKISLVTIAFVSSGDFKEHDAELLEILYRQKGHVIFVLDGNPGETFKELILKIEKSFNTRGTKQIAYVNASKKNQFKISEDILRFIHLGFEGVNRNVVPNRSIELCSEVARKMNFHVDEDLPECFEARQNVNMLMKHVHLNGKGHELPLQLIAVSIGENIKEQHRLLRKGNMQIEDYVDKIKTEIIDLRQKQLHINKHQRNKCAYKLFRASFKNSLIKRKYFYALIKVMTDRYSIDKLQPIRRQYIDKWNRLCDAPKNEPERTKESLKSMKDQLDDLEQKLSRESLGLEHFFREIGQNYEMVSDLKLQEVDDPDLAVIAAEMLLQGYPIELMDGDASHVPLTWIGAVFKSLQYQVGNKHLFVLSVLGIQSSGKSTMLNTMFGLQFAVSAGRCTKGIFAQMMPLDSGLKEETKCDYILVVDTEGLRSPEFVNIQHSYSRDNEIATFVVGLGDLTLINIMGENPTDMQDTLQIAVHAFIKMENVNVNPSCIFVHQNVTDVAASDLNTTQKRSMREMLDKITKIAAAEEHCSEKYRSFSDVIRFEENKDIVYVPNMWQGDPPMAPPNPGYSEIILQTKKRVIESMRNSKPRSIDGFAIMLTDLWNAILCQNVVFSFKNSFEIQAFNALNTEYVKHSRTFRRNAMIYSYQLRNECKQLTAVEIANNGKDIFDRYLTKLQQDIGTFKSSMNSYFDKETIACQWKAQMELQLDDLCKEIKKELNEGFTSVKNKIIGRAEIDARINMHEEEVFQKAKQLAEDHRIKLLSDENLECEFTENWNKWISTIPGGEDYINVEESFERIVVESSLISDRDEVARVLLSDLSQIDVQEQDVLFDERLLKLRLDNRSYLAEANSSLHGIREKYMKEIRVHKSEGSNYTKQLGIYLFSSILSEIGEVKLNDKIHFTLKGKIRLAICNFKWLVSVLREMQEQYRGEHDLKIYMTLQKDRLWHMFRDECREIQISVKMASVISREIKSAVVVSLPNKCAIGVIDHLRNSPSKLFTNKMSVHAYLLIAMAEKHNFKSFVHYLSDPIRSIEYFIHRNIETFCFRTNIAGKTLLQEIYSQNVRKIFMEVKQTISALCQKGTSTMKTWWPSLIERIYADLSVKRNIGVNEDGILDLEDLKENLLLELKLIEDSIITVYDDISIFEKIKYDCFVFFTSDLLACRELCPFCKGLCDLHTNNTHGSHRTELHRPKGVAGYVYAKSKKLSTMVCTTSMRQDNGFRNEDTFGKLYKYSDYRSVNDYYKSWKIEPLEGKAELFWKWFMATYNSELAEYYNANKTDIPRGWKRITWEEAKREIMKTYHL
ncbi:interferon-induced very large GTPase 1-like [Antedon mediterranea]|uniref:interferon-induced very large GTPase 1-like n=1 Tax=Antedon mediterranea TaxID=105859 RepID=UPI003AF5A246